MASSRTRRRYAGESEYVSIDFVNRLDVGQSISAVTWTAESPVTEVVATSGIQGTVVSACFDSPQAGEYTVQAAIETINPVETLIEYVVLVVTAIPT